MIQIVWQNPMRRRCRPCAIRGGKMTGDKPKEFGCLGIVDEVRRENRQSIPPGIKLAR